MVMRLCRREGQPITAGTMPEIADVLRADQANQGAEEPLGAALRLRLESGDLRRQDVLDLYFAE